MLNFGAIATYFKEDVQLIVRGENAYKSNHVKKAIYDGETFVIKGEVYTSQKNKFYTVEHSILIHNIIIKVNS